MKCESCLTDMTAEEIMMPTVSAIKYTCPNGCTTVLKTPLWTATEIHNVADDDGFYTLYESGVRE